MDTVKLMKRLEERKQKAAEQFMVENFRHSTVQDKLMILNAMTVAINFTAEEITQIIKE